MDQDEGISMVDVALVYPYFHREGWWRRLWLFPPLGLGYLAAVLREAGHTVAVLDGTFSSFDVLAERLEELRPRVIGVYCMVTMKDAALALAERFKGDALLVAGGPFPTSAPQVFLGPFDVVVRREGEATFLELVERHLKGEDLHGIDGIAHKKDGEIIQNRDRDYIGDMDSLPFPARDLFENQRYKEYWSDKFGYRCTPVMGSRGCPYNCEYCARPVFGRHYRERSPRNVVDEIEEVLKLGYERVWFSDDVFTLKRDRTMALCDEIMARGLEFDWDCLCRVDSVDGELFARMRAAGCRRVFFGIESGDEGVLRTMRKRFTPEDAKRAVRLAKAAGIEVGTWFILGYPGETNETMLRTLRFSAHLPSDYLSYTMPYPLPGTDLYEKVQGTMVRDEWKMAGHNILMFKGEFREAKLKFGIYKGVIQHRLRKRGFHLAADLFEVLTDPLFRIL
ncbi:MAG: B12-binding domain-containing radical SAM protein [Euryarchaeota archaeon]|nr:B12-binding domain-containing radical SAM protein [Euryarchaeota archaeon]